LGEDEAEKAAVESLGNARKTKRDLKKVFLTWQEEKMLEWIGVSRFPFTSRQAFAIGRASILDDLQALAWLGAYLFVVFGVPVKICGDFWGFWGLLVGLSVGLTLLVATREGVYATYANQKKYFIHVQSLDEALKRHAMGMTCDCLLCGCFCLWVLRYYTFWTEHSLPALNILFTCLAFAGLLFGYAHVRPLQKAARKLRMYPKENTTLNVLALRYRLEEEQEMQESGS